MLRKPGADELSSPVGTGSASDLQWSQCSRYNRGSRKREPHKWHSLTVLIPNLDRHFIHIKQYQDTNRTPRPGHASFASFMKYGPDDDAIGAGIFSGRYTSAIVAAGYIAKKILRLSGINVFSYVKEMGGVSCPEMNHDLIREKAESYKEMRRDFDPFYQEIYVKNRITMSMRFLEKVRIFSEIEKEIDAIRDKAPIPDKRDQ